MTGVVRVFALLCCLLAASSHATGDVPAFARLPLLGWSSWNTFQINVNETIVRESAAKLASTPLMKAGYNYVLIDDGWAACLEFDPTGDCTKSPPRNADGTIPVDPKKFPSGLKSLCDYVHSLGLKVGIYTSVSALTCGGYIGSLHHEREDAKQFAEAGFDFVKHDTCGTDCGVHDGCIQHAALEMAEGLVATGRDIIYYLDNGNPTSPQRVYNPHNYHVNFDEALIKVATAPSELVWYWSSQLNATIGPHMTKSWFDRKDTWESMLTNVHNQVRVAEYQRPGRFNCPDMLTVGMGGQTQGQYRAEFFLYTILGAPLIAGNDIRNMDTFTLELLTAPEVLAIAQDPDCVQGSLVHAMGSWESWIRPLHDKTFAVVLVNKGEQATNATVFIDKAYNWGDFYPAFLKEVHVRDVHARHDLGTFKDRFVALIPPMDARIYKFTPLA